MNDTTSSPAVAEVVDEVKPRKKPHRLKSFVRAPTPAELRELEARDKSVLKIKADMGIVGPHDQQAMSASPDSIPHKWSVDRVVSAFRIASNYGVVARPVSEDERMRLLTERLVIDVLEVPEGDYKKFHKNLSHTIDSLTDHLLTLSGIELGYSGAVDKIQQYLRLMLKDDDIQVPDLQVRHTLRDLVDLKVTMVLTQLLGLQKYEGSIVDNRMRTLRQFAGLQVGEEPRGQKQPTAAA